MTILVTTWAHGISVSALSCATRYLISQVDGELSIIRILQGRLSECQGFWAKDMRDDLGACTDQAVNRISITALSEAVGCHARVAFTPERG